MPSYDPMMRFVFLRQFRERHPIISIFWIPPFVMTFLLAIVFVSFLPLTRDTIHTIPFGSCQKTTGICKTYYLTPFEHFLYLSVLTLAILSFLILWIVGVVEMLRWNSGKQL